MKASYRWLRALVPGLDALPAEVAERLTRAGLEVEGLAAFGQGLEPLLVAAVRRVEPHPARAGLRLVTVDRGASQLQTVVCGAPNVPEPGGLVVLAPVGAHLPAVGMTLTPRDIGGVVSEGMLCSEQEMGLVAPGSSGSDGILVLPADAAPPGTSFLDALPAASDTIFEIAVTPNRPDALGHVGLARELAALYGLPFELPSPESPSRVATGKIDDLARVTVDDAERCPHYGAAVVVDVRVGPSPTWLQYRLASLGVRPISNVVDITNLVLLEFGHPIHAFDLDRVRGQHIVVRRAAAGEQLQTLDGVARQLDSDDLVIADAEGALALAGIMGGAGSEIRSDTRRILIECAYFAPRGVRRSARRHGLHTEASHRFERGVDRGDTPDVLAHAASLVVRLAGGAAVSGAIHAFVTPAPPRNVPLRSQRLDALLGVAVPFAEAAAILDRLGFTVRGSGASAVEVTVPTFRPDVEREVDLIEEVARVRGLDAIPTVLPAIRPQPRRDANVLGDAVRRAAVALGLCEAVTYGFVSPRDLAAVGAPSSPVKLANPLTEERSVMRTSLLPGLLDAVKNARRHGESEARLFTVGTLFAVGDPGALLPRERPGLAAVLVGDKPMYLGKPQGFDVYDAKGVGCELVERVTGRSCEVRPQPQDGRAAHLHPRAAGDLLSAGAVVGRFGQLHPDVLRAWGLQTDAAVVLELDLDALAAAGRAEPRFAPIPRLPAVMRDIALVVHDDVPAGEVVRLVREAAGDLCESVEVFDVFRGGSVPADHRSLALHVVYRDPRAATAPLEARTLTDEQVDQRHADVVKRAKSSLGATLRG